MPRVSAWLVRASLCHLVGGFTIGALLLASKGIPLDSRVWTLRPVHVEMLLVGWMIQLVMGVAIWIFPRFALRRAAPGRAATAWVALGLLNSGVLLVCLGGAAVVVGRLLEIGAAATFAVHLWRRVSPAGIAAL